MIDYTEPTNNQPPEFEFHVGKMGHAYPNQYHVSEFKLSKWVQLCDCFLTQDEADALAKQLTDERNEN